MSLDSVRVQVGQQQAEDEPLVETAAAGNVAEEPTPDPLGDEVEQGDYIGLEVWLMSRFTLHRVASHQSSG